MNRDMHNLKSLARNVEDMVDKDLAHLDKKPHTVTTTFGEMDECIKELDGLVCKYRTLFGGGGMSTLEPAILFDWEDIFTVPLDARTCPLQRQERLTIFVSSQFPHWRNAGAKTTERCL